MKRRALTVLFCSPTKKRRICIYLLYLTLLSKEVKMKERIKDSVAKPLQLATLQEYMLPLRGLDQIYGPHFQHRHGFEYILAIRDAAAQKQYFLSIASVFNVPITLRWLVFAWNYKEEKKANGLVRASDLKIKAFFIYLRTYLALRMRRSFLIGEH